jgi:hypothetical protein
MDLNLDAFDLRKNGFQFPKVETPTIKLKRDRQFLPALPERVFCELVKLPRKALPVYLVALLRSRLEKSRTVTLTTCFLQRFGLTRKDKFHALPHLEQAGLIRVQRRDRRNPVVEILKQAERGL